MMLLLDSCLFVFTVIIMYTYMFFDDGNVGMN